MGEQAGRHAGRLTGKTGKAHSTITPPSLGGLGLGWSFGRPPDTNRQSERVATARWVPAERRGTVL